MTPPGGLAAANADDAAANPPADASAVEVVLHGELAPGGAPVKLYWETRNWPGDLKGFALRRRSGPGEPWEPLGTGVIAPSLDPAKDWSALGLDAAGARAVREVWRERYFGQLRPERGEPIFLDRLRAGGGLGSGDRIRLKRDFNLALICSFGYVDHTYRPAPVTGGARAVEYGLFPAGMDGRTGDSPAAVWAARGFSRSAPAAGLDLGLEVREEAGGVRLGWTLARAAAEARSLVGFHLYRRGGGGRDSNGTEDAGGGFRRLVEHPLPGRPGATPEVIRYSFFDRGADAASQQVYAVAPVSVFQTEYGRAEIAFDPALHGSLAGPEIAAITLVDGVDLELSWGAPAPANKPRVAGFVVERLGPAGFAPVSGQLRPDAQRYRDRDRKRTGEPYTYRLVTLGSDGRRWPSPERGARYLGRRPPPAPAGLQAHYEPRGRGRGVALSWEAVPAAVAGPVSGYRIYSDRSAPGRPVLQGGIPLVRGDRYWFPLKAGGGREYTFGVAAEGADGAISEPAAATCYVPLLRMPPAGGVTVTLDPVAYAADLAWDYPETGDLLGFRLYLGRQRVADESVLDAGARSWSFADASFAPGGRFAFRLQAVGIGATSRLGPPSYLYVDRVRPPEGLAAPTGLEVRLEREGEASIAALTWDPPPASQGGREATGGETRHVLFADYAVEGRPSRLGRVPPIRGSAYRYRLPVTEGRHAYTFRLAPLGPGGRLGPAAEVSLALGNLAAGGDPGGEAKSTTAPTAESR